MTQSGLRTLVWFGVFCAAFIATHSPPLAPGAVPPISDKFMHFMGFTILSLLTVWKWAPYSKRIPVFNLGMCLAGLLIYGAIDELTQPYAGRDCEFSDWMADSAGSVMGLTSGALCQKWLWIGRAAAVLLIVQFNGGCTPKPAEPPDRLLRIVLLARSADSDELPVMKSAALAFMRENKTVSVEVIAPPVQSPEQQRKLLAESASSGAHAICIYPLDPAGISREVNSTVVSGVPIVTIGLDIPNSSRSAYCGPNEAEVGEAAARACSLTMDPWPSRMVIILHGGEEREPYGQRYLAFKNSIGLVKDARILRELNCNGETPEAVRMVALESRKYPRVGAWVLIENWPIPRTPIDPAGWPSQCSVVLCNASPRYFAELRANRISALLGFDVRLAVSKAIQAATWLAQGPRDGGAFDTHMPVEIITRQEVALWEQKWEKWRGPDPGGPAPTATETPGRKSPSS